VRITSFTSVAIDRAQFRIDMRSGTYKSSIHTEEQSDATEHAAKLREREHFSTIGKMIFTSPVAD